MVLGGIYSHRRSFFDNHKYQPEKEYEAFKDRPMRVLAYDERIVMYDSWWSGINKWTFTNFISEGSYYQLPTEFFIEHTDFVRLDELSQTEFEIHRPDLPFSICKVETMGWNMEFDSISELKKELLNNEIEDKLVLAATKIYLKPQGPTGAFKKNILVESKPAKGFTLSELLWKAYQLQHAIPKALLSGMGIHRSGYKRKLPTYYISGFLDALDLMKRAGVTT